MTRARVLVAVLVALALALVLGSCASTAESDPLPVDQIEEVELTVSGQLGRSISIPGTPAVVTYFSQGDVEVPMVTATVRERGNEVTVPVQVIPYDGATVEETDPSVPAAVADALVGLGAVEEEQAEGVAETVMGYVRTFVIGRSADYFLVELPQGE